METREPETVFDRFRAEKIKPWLGLLGKWVSIVYWVQGERWTYIHVRLTKVSVKGITVLSMPRNDFKVIPETFRPDDVISIEEEL